MVRKMLALAKILATLNVSGRYKSLKGAQCTMRIIITCKQLQLHSLCERTERTTLILKHLEKQEQQVIS